VYDEMALQLIEYDLGRSFRKTETTETVSVRASFARLSQQPILEVKRVLAQKKDWMHSSVFGQMASVEIPLSEIELVDGGIILPQTVWGSYDTATVTYCHGYGEIPPDIQEAVRLITERLDGGEVNRYTAQLLLHSEDIEELLRPYRTAI
jgi:hypothetical protein